ncbi:hypothetical protein F4604DRAFT_1978761 [Suillus subluteus]|nr:hypothetical protein F4604DRAFT_1978761 [Suillus subluteus]
MPRTRTTNQKPTLGTKKKFQALQRKVDANEREVQDAIREKEARKKLKACQKKGAITRPDGTAGRHFNLQHAMNLDDKDSVYKIIRYKIVEISKDNGLRLETTSHRHCLALSLHWYAMLEIPYLAHFKDGWPVKDFLQQYLRNHANYRRRMGYDKPSSNKITLSKGTRAHIFTSGAKLPAPAARSDSDDSSETDPGSDSDSDSDSDSEEIGPGSEGGLPADIAELFKMQVEDYLSEFALQCTLPALNIHIRSPKDASPKPQHLVPTLARPPKLQTVTTSSKKIATAVTQVRRERAKPPGVTKQRSEPPPPPPSQNSASDDVVVMASAVLQWKNLEKEKAKVTPSTHYAPSTMFPGSPASSSSTEQTLVWSMVLPVLARPIHHYR